MSAEASPAPRQTAANQPANADGKVPARLGPLDAESFTRLLEAEATVPNVEVIAPDYLDIEERKKDPPPKPRARHKATTRRSLRSLQLRNCSLQWIDFSDLEIRALASIPETTFYECDLSGVRARNLRASSSIFRESALNGAEMPGADFSNVIFESVELVGTRLRGANLTRAQFDHVEARSAMFTEALLGFAGIVSSSFSDCSLQGVSFNQTTLENVTFSQETRLIGASFFDAVLTNIDFRGAKLGSAHFPRSAELHNVCFDKDGWEEADIDPGIKNEVELREDGSYVVPHYKYEPEQLSTSSAETSGA